MTPPKKGDASWADVIICIVACLLVCILAAVIFGGGGG